VQFARNQGQLGLNPATHTIGNRPERKRRRGFWRCSGRTSYIKDVLTRLPTQPAGRIEESLPHRWQASASR
jgi:hypothetical protein